jgi:hypothetical protein
LFEAYAEPKGYNLTRIAINKFDVSWLGFSREDDLVAFKFGRVSRSSWLPS